MGDNLVYAYRSVKGLFVKRGLNPPKDVLTKQLDVRTNMVRAMKFSCTGKFLAYCESEKTVCVDTTNGNELFAHPFSKTTRIMFSPDDSIMVTYEPYVIYGSRTDQDGNTKKPNPNLRFFNTSSGALLATLIQRNQFFWQPMFTEDGRTFVLTENSELHFFDSNSPERFNRKGTIRGLENLKVSPGQDPIIAAFVLNKTGTNLISLRNFHGDLSTICQRSTFNADKCEFHWNTKGNACLAITSVEVDSSNQSYYGVNYVFLLTKTGENIPVPLNKKGPVHSLQWSPTGNQFCICYGFMPSKVAVFNLKASVVWDLGESHRNEIYYNTFGTILATCGFGNIASGRIQMWDVEKREEIVAMEIPNTTYFEWAPNGQHFLTATTSPRLRMDNNFQIWSYLGDNIYGEEMVEDNKQLELAQVVFKPAPTEYNKFKVKILTQEEKKQRVQSRIPTDGHPVNQMRKAGVITGSSVYVPPALRKATSTNNQNSASNAGKESGGPKSNITAAEKKIRHLRKKVKEIEVLKKRQDEGELLEKNQLAKIDKLHELKLELDKIAEGEAVETA